MDYVKNPKAIEDKSMEIIYDYVKDLGLTDDEFFKLWEDTNGLR